MENCSSDTELVNTMKKLTQRISEKKEFSTDPKQNTIAILDLETKKE